jgi:hypothetical protein
VSAKTYRFVTALKKRGTRGEGIRSLIECGIREAIDKGYIRLDAAEN